MRRLDLQVLWVGAVILLALSMAHASVGGSISGTVRDASGGVVPGARVTITNVNTGVSQAVTSNSLGVYSFLALPVGSYRLAVAKQGFQNYERTGITLNTNDQLRYDVALRVGQVTQQIQVTTSAVHVETVNTQMGDVITGSRIEAMPLNGRMFTDLLGLQPGVVPVQSTQATGYSNYFGTTESGNVSISGQRETSNGFLINGSNVNDPLNNGTTVVPNLDAIAEFRVLTADFDAQYGDYSGGLVTVVTKSGTNQFHGDAFDFLRNTSLDSRGFFDASREAFQQNQFGGTLGGPIRRDKVFFFADYQGTRNNIGQSTGQVSVPTLAERNGDFSALASSLTGTVGGTYWAGLLSSELGYPVTNGEPYYTAGCTSSAQCVFPDAVIPQSAFSPPAKALMRYVPLPNVGASLFFSPANTVHTRGDLGSGRLDLSTNHWGMISVYYFMDDTSELYPFGTNNTPGFPTENGGRAQLVAIGETKSFGPSALNDLHLSFNRNVFHSSKPLNGFGITLASLGFNENKPGGIVDSAGSLEGVPNVGFNTFSIGMAGVNYNRYEDTPSVLDNFSKVVGKHTVMLGGQYMFNDFYEPMPLVGGNGFFGFNGTETGIDFADYLIGAPTSFTQEGGFNVDNRRSYGGVFAQDSWRARPKFSVNYGLRWDVIQPWYEKHNQASTFVYGVHSTVYPGAPTGYVFPGDTVPGSGKIPPTIAPTRYHGFAPRFGFAYSPSHGGTLGRLLGGPDKFSIRGGWGLFYQNLEGVIELNETGLAPFDVYYPAPLPVVFQSPYTNRLDGGTHQPFPFNTQNFNWPLELPLSGYPVPPINQLVPYTETYNLTVQRQFGDSTLVTVGYIGNQGHHLLAYQATNPGNPQLCLSLSQPADVAPGSPTCGPFLENAVFTRANGTVVDGTRFPFGSTNFGDNVWAGTFTDSAYNSLQISVRHTTSRMNIFAGYTFSKSLDNSSNLDDQQPNPLNFRLSRGLSSFDVTHDFVASYSYTLPIDRLASSRWPRLTSGWQVVGITHFATGFPIIMSENDDHSLIGHGMTDTPDFLGGNLNFTNPRSANVANGKPYFNTTLFTPSAIGFEGTANKAFFHGPGLNDWDMSLLKDAQLTERARLEFRAEFFDIFNHAQFYNPSGNITAGPSVFGIVNSARPGRIGQLVLKLIF